MNILYLDPFFLYVHDKIVFHFVSLFLQKWLRILGVHLTLCQSPIEAKNIEEEMKVQWGVQIWNIQILNTCELTLTHGII